MTALTYRHMDVFAAQAFQGNSLAVFIDPSVSNADQLLRITQELRHFESIFLWPTPDPMRWSARVFDLIEELPFAGHPVLGAAAVLHERCQAPDAQRWLIDLRDKTVCVDTIPAAQSRWLASLNQGDAEFGSWWPTTGREGASIAAAFSLDPNMLRPDLPMSVISTGLRYLIVPVTAIGLSNASISHDLTTLLVQFGAQFAVLLEPERPEARHWNNDGIIEDVATGSAAGTIAAYLRQLDRLPPSSPVTLHQGRFAGRPSELTIEASGAGTLIHDVTVGGMVCAVGGGQLDAIPAVGERSLSNSHRPNPVFAD